MLYEIVHELLRHRSGDGRIGGRAVVAGVAVEPHLVLHLNHYHGLLPGVDVLDVLHHGGVSLAVGLRRGGSERAEYRERPAVLGKG